MRFIINPAYHLTGFCFRNPEHVIHIIEEQISLLLQLFVGIILLMLKEHKVVFCIPLPTCAKLIKESCIIAILIYISDFDRLFYSLFFAFCIFCSLFNFFSLNIIFKLSVHIFSETFDNTASIFLKALIDSRIRSRKSYISLTKNIVRREYAGDR